jgi:hypothetical protein
MLTATSHTPEQTAVGLQEVTVNKGFVANSMLRIRLSNTVKGKVDCKAQILHYGLFRGIRSTCRTSLCAEPNARWSNVCTREYDDIQQLAFLVGVNQDSAVCTVLVHDVCSLGISAFPSIFPLRTGISVFRATTSACPVSPLATEWKWPYATS